MLLDERVTDLTGMSTINPEKPPPDVHGSKPNPTPFAINHSLYLDCITLLVAHSGYSNMGKSVTIGSGIFLAHWRYVTEIPTDITNHSYGIRDPLRGATVVLLHLLLANRIGLVVLVRSAPVRM